MAKKHYNEQVEYTSQYFLPYLKKHIPNFSNLSILEIGCAEAGTLKLFEEEGHKVTGIEIEASRIETAKENNPEVNIIHGDISDPSIREKIEDKYDLIILREVIEHIPDKENTFKNLDLLLNDNGYIFFSFPPKYSPFAGHQQVGISFLKKIPYLHFLPRVVLDFLSRKLGESDKYTDHVKMNYNTGMSISRFLRFIKTYGMKSVQKDLYFIRPIYYLRYGAKTKHSVNIPLLREMVTFGFEALYKKGK